MNLANVLTVSRILLVPVFAIAFVQGQHLAAALIFLVAAATDMADGIAARIGGVRSSFGRMIDPLADKFLVLTAFVLLSVSGEVPSWCTIVIFGREIIVVGGWTVRHILMKSSSVVPTGLGKAMAVAQMTAVVAILASSHSPVPVVARLSLLYLAAGLTVASGAQYLARGLGELEGGRPK